MRRFEALEGEKITFWKSNHSLAIRQNLLTEFGDILTPLEKTFKFFLRETTFSSNLDDEVTGKSYDSDEGSKT
jgi:hypothetical protein